MMPVKDGWEVCREIRQRYGMPVIILTARSEDYDKILGLELGADDYITKPFNPRELVARVRAVLRRSRQSGGEPACCSTRGWWSTWMNFTVTKRVSRWL